MKKTKSLMQSEVFIIIMIIIVLLYISMSMYANILENENKKKDSNITKLIKENNDLKDINTTTCIELKDLDDNSHSIEEQNITICIKLKNLLNKNKLMEEQNSTILKLKKEKNLSKEKIAKLESIQKKYMKLTKDYNAEKEEWKKHKKPPLITLSEDGEKEKEKFAFKKGKASISKLYESRFMEYKFPQLVNNIIEFDCDTIEVYGFTDTTSYDTKNVDRKLHNCIENDCQIDRINIHSNLELGMKRAISIVHFLKQQQILGNIRKDIIIKPYSAGQFIDENGKVSTTYEKDIPKRRRIEIRLSRSKR